MSARTWRGLLPSAALAAALALSACGSALISGARAQVLVVDSLGNPVRGAVVLPDDDSPASHRGFTEAEMKERSTNGQGLLAVFLDDFLWASDGNYHLRVLAVGFEDEAMTVSKDLFPPVLRVELRRPGASAPAPRPR